MEELTSVPTWLWVVVGVAAVLQLSLMIWALVDVIRRPDAQIRGPKWLWVIVIIFGQLIGPIVYLAVARLPEAVDVARPTPTADRASAAADVLYGSTPAGAPGQPADEPVQEPPAGPGQAEAD